MAETHTYNNIKTPHAAVIIWNYDDRIGSEDINGVKDGNKVTNKIVVSSLSCVSIQTSKSKSNPVGTFNLVLAPNKNWISTITVGSWCCIMMSDERILEDDMKKANYNHVKMIGKIDSIRVEVSVDFSGARKTMYYVSGVDWGHIFNNTIYIDKLIADNNRLDSDLAIAIRNSFAGGITLNPTRKNILQLIGLIGKTIGPLEPISIKVSATYDISMPDDLKSFLGADANSIGPNIDLYTGQLKSKQTEQNPYTYSNSSDSFGFINPATIIGTHTYWQLILDNVNDVLNEAYCEMDVTNKKPFVLICRTRPFSINEKGNAAYKSLFKNVRSHNIQKNDVISINAGVNWADKCNFIEIKPGIQDQGIFDQWLKIKSQHWDGSASGQKSDTFNREGFRPRLFTMKHFPIKQGANSGATKGDFKQLVELFDIKVVSEWLLLLREWYFDTHRMLNGSISMAGITGYIAVGDNIVFDSSLLNATSNINKESVNSKKNPYIVAHVENVMHTFTVDSSGARSYITQIDFVRGVISKSDDINILYTIDKISDMPETDTTNNEVIASGEMNKEKNTNE